MITNQVAHNVKTRLTKACKAASLFALEQQGVDFESSEMTKKSCRLVGTTFAAKLNRR
jgi:hypothetical protein